MSCHVCHIMTFTHYLTTLSNDGNVSYLVSGRLSCLGFLVVLHGLSLKLLICFSHTIFMINVSICYQESFSHRHNTFPHKDIRVRCNSILVVHLYFLSCKQCIYWSLSPSLFCRCLQISTVWNKQFLSLKFTMLDGKDVRSLSEMEP